MGKVLLSEEASVSAPAAGQMAIYPKTDSHLYRKDDAGNEVSLDSLDIGPSATQLEISAAGLVTFTGPGWYTIETNGGGAADDLESVTGLTAGNIVILQAANGAHTVTVKNAGNIHIGADFALDNEYDSITLLCISAGVVIKLSSADNGA
jgi:hypothetical protein